MSEYPTPAVMLSTKNSADVTITAFQYGTVDFDQKLQEGLYEFL
jgi:hypothetical protein